VKLLVAVAAISILGVIAFFRKEPAGNLRPSLPRRQQQSVADVTQWQEQGKEVRLAGRESEAPPTPIVPAAKSSSTEMILSSDTQQMEFALKDELALTEQQNERVHEALVMRELELRECQDAIRKSGVFDPRAYGKKLIGMKEGWTRNIDGVLDSRQHQRFQELLASGILRPGTEFLADLDSMTVIR